MRVPTHCIVWEYNKAILLVKVLESDVYVYGTEKYDHGFATASSCASAAAWSWTSRRYCRWERKPEKSVLEVDLGAPV